MRRSTKDSLMPARKTYHHGDLRAKLLALATAHVLSDGVDSVSVRALAREAGVAHRAAYQHFPDKDALVAAVLAAAHDRLFQRLKRAVAKVEPPTERLVKIARAYAAFAFDEPLMFLAMTGPRVNASGNHPDLERALARSWHLITGAINDGVDSGEYAIGDGFAASAIFWGGLQGVISQAVLGRLKLKKSARARFVEMVALRLIAGLRPVDPL